MREQIKRLKHHPDLLSEMVQIMVRKHLAIAQQFFAADFNIALSATSKPLQQRSKVLFPEPLGPMMTIT